MGIQRLLILLLLVNTCYGWLGAGRSSTAEKAKPQRRSLLDSKEPWVELLSWKPRAFLYHNFLEEGEAEHLIRLAKPFMKRSTVVGQGGQSVMHDIRTSYGCFLNRHTDEVVTKIERRLAVWTRLNVSHQEDIQILRYSPGQKYGSHMDVLEEGSKRVATALIYLADTEEGGETAFTAGSEWADPSSAERLGPFSECAQGHVASKPKKGNALLFWDLHLDGQLDTSSQHAGCPVIKGVKWTATFWIHTDPFRPEYLEQPVRTPAIPLPEVCRDLVPECKGWAESGECKNNAKFMVGDASGMGQCRASCGECEVCASNDVTCMKRNRERAGYLPLDAE